MVKGTIRRHALGAALALLLPPLCLSCGEDGTSPVGTGGGGDGTVTIGLTLTASYGYDEAGKYETGSDYENYIDVAGGDYRIYFFTDDDANKGNDVLIAAFEPDEAVPVPVTGSGYTEYSVYGEAPDALTTHDTFKVVMLANWGTDNYPDVEAGTTTIDDICEHSTDNSKYTFSHLTDFELSPTDTPKRLIPFFGVHAYTGVKFKANDATVLREPVTLLRAMAKVEVVFEPNEDDVDAGITSFDYVKAHRYNDRGYCAPANVYSEDDYDSNYTKWETDFVEGLHLVGNANDEDSTTEGKSLDFLKTQEYDGEDTYETWTAYLPEYSNTSDADDYSYIEVYVNDTSYQIYFAEYEDGTTKNDYTQGERYDIRRNVLYRFYVSLALGDPRLRVHVGKWDNGFNNSFEFGSSSSND